MSHCTKFDFTYTSEEAIVKAFGKLGLTPSTTLVSEFASDFSKKVLGKLGYMGRRQYRAIYANFERFNIFACKVADATYELLIERSDSTVEDDAAMSGLALAFQKAYVSVAIDETIHRIESTGVPARALESKDGFSIEFGSNYEFSVLVTVSGNQIIEEVSGVKGDICTKLTEELEALLSNPSSELITEWKPAYTMVHEDQTLQILTASW